MRFELSHSIKCRVVDDFSRFKVGDVVHVIAFDDNGFVDIKEHKEAKLTRRLRSNCHWSAKRFEVVK